MIGIQRMASASGISVRVSATSVVPLLVLTTVLIISLVSIDVPANSFRSPDEHASYLFTKTFGDTGRLSYTRDYLEDDQENLLHPRGALTVQGKAVPFNYLGLPVMYAPAYKLLGDNARFAAIPFALVTVSALAAAGSMLVPQRRWLPWVAVLSATPIIYYLNRPFLNTFPSTMFMAIGVYLFLQHFRAAAPGSWRWLAGGSVAFALAAFARYEFVIFEGLFVAVFLVHKHGMDVRRAGRDMAFFVGATLALFVLPVLILNELTYGSPLTFGYGLFNEVYFPSRAGGGSFLEGLMAIARSILLPTYPLDLSFAGNSLINQVFGIAPIFAVVALLGLVSVVWNQVVRPRYLFAYLAIAVYVFLYRGAGYSWLADSSTPSFEASIVRYVLPLYMALYLLAVYGLAQVRSAHLAAAFACVLAIVGVLSLMRDVDGNLNHIRTQVRAGDQLVVSQVVPNTEPDALIYTDIFDKIIGPYRDVAAWWGGVRGTHEGFFKPDEVARSIYRVYPDRPVYLYLFEEEFVVPRLEEALSPWGLDITRLDPRRLYRIDESPNVAAP